MCLHLMVWLFLLSYRFDTTAELLSVSEAWTVYVDAAFWILLTITTAGFGNDRSGADITWARLLIIMLYELVGVLYMSFFITKVIKFLADMTAVSNSGRMKMEAFDDWMTINEMNPYAEISHSYNRSLLRYFKFIFQIDVPGQITYHDYSSKVPLKDYRELAISCSFSMEWALRKYFSLFSESFCSDVVLAASIVQYHRLTQLYKRRGNLSSEPSARLHSVGNRRRGDRLRHSAQIHRPNARPWPGVRRPRASGCLSAPHLHGQQEDLSPEHKEVRAEGLAGQVPGGLEPDEQEADRDLQ